MASKRRSIVRSAKPAWWVLYAVFPAAIVLLFSAHIGSPSAGWRKIAEVVASLIVMGAMALWVRANRVALTLDDDQQDSRNMAEVREGTWLDDVDRPSLEEVAGSRHGFFRA